MNKLNHEQVKLIEKILIESKASNKLIDDLKKKSGCFDDLKSIDKILDILANELTSKGLLVNYEPNDYGKQIDDLISFYSKLKVRYNK